MTLTFRKVFKDYLTSSISTVVVMISFLIEFRLVHQFFGPADFGIYSSIRRIVSRSSAFFTFCLGMAVSRFLAQEKEGPRMAPTYFWSYLRPAFIGLAIYGILIWTLPSEILEPFFGEKFHRSFFLILLAMSLSALIFDVVYSVFRGLHNYSKANLCSLLISALIPVASVIAFSGVSLQAALLAGAMGGITASLILVWPILKTQAIEGPSLERKLLKFSLPRIPGVLLNGALVIIPSWHFARNSSLSELGYFNAVMSLAGLATVAAEPLGRVLYTTFSFLSAGGIDDRVKRGVSELASLSINAGTFLSLFFGITASYFLSVWLGSEHTLSSSYIHILSLGLLGMTLFELLWRPIDAMKEFPYLIVTTSVGLIAYFCTGIFLGFTPEGTCWAWTMARTTQGLLSLVIALRVVKIRIPWIETLAALGVCISAYILDQNWMSLALGMAWILFLILRRPAWLERLVKEARSRVHRTN